MSNQDIVCPFCGEDGFDKIGLKGHLAFDCKEYSETEISDRLFTDYLLFEALRYREEQEAK